MLLKTVVWEGGRPSFRFCSRKEHRTRDIHNVARAHHQLGYATAFPWQEQSHGEGAFVHFGDGGGAARVEWWFRVGAALGALGVVTGAFGAHALRGRVNERMFNAWNTAANYQLLHAVAIVAVAAFRGPLVWVRPWA